VVREAGAEVGQYNPASTHVRMKTPARR
jgi:hypothetical protein